MSLQYRKAVPQEADRVCYIVQTTKALIYPKYYTKEVVDFFGRLHSIENIKSDIALGRIYVLPEFQGQSLRLLRPSSNSPLVKH